MRSITKKQAARFLLLRHGLLGPYRYAGKEGALDFVRSAGCIQYDPIDVCGRNAELVLQARVKGFRKEMLHELLYNERRLFDYWDKCMSIIPAEDWPYFARTRNAWSYNEDAVRPALAHVRETVVSNGPCCSDDIPNGKQKVRWPWGAAPIGRAALETLYFQGELVVFNKQGTRKYYDLADRHLPRELLQKEDRTGHRKRITVGRSHGASEALVCSGTGRPMRIWRFVAWMPHRGRLRSKAFAAKGCWMKWRWKAFASHCICSHGIFLCLRKLAPQNPFRPAVHSLRLWTICCGIAS